MTTVYGRDTRRRAVLSADGERVLAFIREHPGCTNKDIAAACGITHKTAYHLASVVLVARNLFGVQEHLPASGFGSYILRYFPELAPPPSSPVALGRSKSTEPEAS